MASPCCRLRTCVLMLGFVLGFIDIALWILFYTYRIEFRSLMGYTFYKEEDLIGLSVVVCLDLVVNVLLISGANKDYSGQQRDLKRWGLIVPWLVIYTINIIGLFGGSILIFVLMQGFKKWIGVPPLIIGFFLIGGHITVSIFVVKQRQTRVMSSSCTVTSGTADPEDSS